jgi:hypothetical protein
MMLQPAHTSLAPGEDNTSATPYVPEPLVRTCEVTSTKPW